MKNFVSAILILASFAVPQAGTAQSEPDPAKTAAFFERDKQAGNKSEMAKDGCKYGWYAISRGYLDSAESAFKGATELDPKCAEAWFGLARLSKIRKDEKQKKEYLAKAVALDKSFASTENRAKLEAPHTVPSPHTPRRDAVASTQMGWERFQKKQLNEALEFFKGAIRYDPSYPSGYFGVAYVYSVQGRLKEAIPMYRETTKRAPDFPDGHGNLARALLMTGQTAEAEKELAEAVRLNPKLGDAVVNFAYHYAEKGDWTKAKRYALDAKARGAKVDPEAAKEFKKHGIEL